MKTDITQMKLNHTYKYILALMLLLFSCQKEEVPPAEAITDAITFTLKSNGNYSASTRAGQESVALVSNDGKDTLILQLSEISDIYTDTTTTKGTAITGNNLKEKCPEKIALQAFWGNNKFIDDVLVFDNDGSARTKTPSYWPVAEDAMVDFWSYHPKETALINNLTITNNTNTHTITLNYNQKKENDNTLVDATQQEDLFFAYTQAGKETGSVNLTYQHALSAIKFSAGKALAGEIRNISITNIHASGTLTFSPTAENNKFSWELTNEKYTLNQNFEKKIDEDITGDASQGIAQDIENTTFMLIPQDITATTGEGAKELTIKYLKAGETEATEYKAILPDGKWEAGKAYTYTLTLMDGMGFEIEPPTTTNNTINGIEIKNTYNKPCYIRAMIIANWVDSEGNIAAIFYPSEIDLKITASPSNYVKGENWDNNWWYDEDTNIYYYKRPLQKDGNPIKLFETFTNPKPNTEGLNLDFTVLVQAVEADNNKTYVKTAWGEKIYQILEYSGESF